LAIVFDTASALIDGRAHRLRLRECDRAELVPGGVPVVRGHLRVPER
jgi:hypothetical protein